MADPPRTRIPIWKNQPDTFNWKDLFLWNSVGWYEAVLIGVWGALMGTGDYDIANWFFVVAAFLFCLKWGHVCHIHNSRRHVARFLIGIAVTSTLAFVVVWWTSRKTIEAAAQRTQMAKLDQIPYMEIQVAELPVLRKQVSDLSSLVNSETARREQAEQDMKSTVQKTGSDTRTGIAEDIRKSPIHVEITGPASIAPPKPLEAPNYRIIQAQCQKEHDDAPYCVKVTLQVDKPQPGRVLVAFHMSSEIKYSRYVNLPGAFTGAVTIHPKDKTIFVVSVAALGAVTLSPDQSWSFFLSAESPISATQLEVAPQN